jgi:hypothetical protein
LYLYGDGVPVLPHSCKYEIEAQYFEVPAQLQSDGTFTTKTKLNLQQRKSIMATNKTIDKQRPLGAVNYGRRGSQVR